MITIDKDKNGLFYFHVTAKNGAILCHSEGYTRKENAKKAILKLEDELLAASDQFGNFYEGKVTDKTKNGK